MMLGRLARSLATPALRRGNTVGFIAPKAPIAMPVRNASSIPTTLSVRYDGLVMQCMIAAIVHFVPIDAVVVVGALISAYQCSKVACPAGPKVTDKDAAIESFKAKKGLDDVKVYKNKV